MEERLTLICLVILSFESKLRKDPSNLDFFIRSFVLADQTIRRGDMAFIIMEYFNDNVA